MKIQSSTISLSGKSTFIQKYSKEETLKEWVGNKRPDFEKQQLEESAILDLSEELKKYLDAQKKQFLEAQEKDKISSTAKITEEQTYEISNKDKMKLEMLQKMLESLTGKKIKFYLPEKIKLNLNNTKINSAAKNPNNINTPQPLKGFGIEYDLHESYHEEEKMSFSCQGIIKTQDQKEINFSVQLSMSREFSTQQNISLRAGDAKIDPLIINFDGNAASLTETKYSFDLDSNGSYEQISFATNGSGFLAIDKNSDEKINDGSELFGPQTANGFLELSKYDDDKNGWIDENDSIFEKLCILTKEDGEDKLFAIGSKGIGAIYLGNVDTAFNLKDQSNKSLGEVQKTGIFVKENGSVGTIQHIDLTI